MISLRQIRSFVAVCEASSFTGAAEREGATQSGISQHIKRETELDGAVRTQPAKLLTPSRLYTAMRRRLKQLRPRSRVWPRAERQHQSG